VQQQVDENGGQGGVLSTDSSSCVRRTNIRTEKTTASTQGYEKLSTQIPLNVTQNSVHSKHQIEYAFSLHNHSSKIHCHAQWLEIFNKKRKN
jgi:hypothetical protein